MVMMIAPDPKPKKNRELKTEILPVRTPQVTTPGGGTPAAVESTKPILERAAVAAKTQAMK